MSKTYLTSVQTTLIPQAFGKRDQRLSNSLKTRVTVTLFKPQKPVYKVMPYISATGKLTPIRLTLAYLSDSVTGTPSLALRPVFVSTSLDPKPYTTNDNRIVYSDSNEHIMQLIKMDQSPYNAFNVSGNFGTAYIPKSAETWDNNKHNAHALVFIERATALANQPNITDSVRQQGFDKLYKEYLAVEQKLLADDIVVSNSIIVAQESGVQPVTTIHQNMHSRNDFLNADKVFGNENSLATFAPITNEVHGSMRLVDSKANGNWMYGLSENNGLSTYSVAVNFFDFRNKVDTTEARIVVRDRFAQNAESKQRTRSESLEDFVANNSAICLYDAKLKLAPTELGGLTSTFSLEGDNMTYTKAPIATQESILVDADVDESAELKLDSMDDFVIGATEFSFEDLGISPESTALSDDDDDVPFSSNSISSTF